MLHWLSCLNRMRRRSLLYLRGVLPRSDLPGAVQPTPCGLNRYVLLLAYCFYVFITGSVYMGWTPLATMILRAGGYSYLCTEDSSAFLEGRDGRKVPGVCNAQEAAVQRLYTVTLAVHCSCSALAGFLVDCAGPRITALIGQALSFVGWCVMGSTTPASHYTLPIAFVLIGFGVDTSVLPHLCITRLFPGSAGLVITITGSAASASMFVPLILESFGGTDLKACWVYACAGPGLMFFVALTLLPYRNFVVYEAQGKVEGVEKNEGFEENSLPAGSRNTQISSTTGGQPEEDAAGEHQQREQWPEQHHQQEQQQGRQQAESAPGKDTDVSVSFGVKASLPCTDTSSNEDGARNDVRDDVVISVSANEAAAEGGSGSRGFWSQVRSERYLLIVLYFVGVVWASAFYQQAPRRTFSPSVVSFLEVVLPLSFIPCIVLGKIADIWGIVRVMLGLNSCGVLMYALAMVKREPAGYASVLCFCIYMSLFMGQIFVYVDCTFPPEHFGKLVGLVAMVGGLLSLLCNILYEVAVTGGERGLFICQITMVSLLLLQFAVLWRLYYHSINNPSPYRAPRCSTNSTIDNGDVRSLTPQPQQEMAALGAPI